MTNQLKYIIRGIGISILIFLMAPAPARGDTYYALCKPNSQVNIRKNPRTGSEYCGYLLTGDCVTVTDYRKDNRGRIWCKVVGLTEYGEGWVCEAYLAGSEVTEDGGKYTVKANGRVATYNGIAGKRTGWIKPGQTVTVLARSRTWAIYHKGYVRMLWLKERSCDKLINPREVERYAEAVARYVQCSEAISQFGLLGKHPTTGAPMASPFVSIQEGYRKSIDAAWYNIFAVVKENSTTAYTGDPGADSMEMLLQLRRRR